MNVRLVAAWLAGGLSGACLVACSVGDLPTTGATPDSSTGAEGAVEASADRAATTDAGADAPDATVSDGDASSASGEAEAGAEAHASADAYADADAYANADAGADAGVDAGGEADAPGVLCPYSDWVGDGCAPVCGNGNFGPGGVIDGGPYDGLPHVVPGLCSDGLICGVVGVSASGSILHIHEGSVGDVLLLSIPSAISPTGYLTYTLIDPSQPNAPQVGIGATETLSFDGSWLVLETLNGDAFVEASILPDFTVGPTTEGHFAQVNASLPQGGLFTNPVLSADGLTLYYTVYQAANPAQDGIYASTRAAPDQPFGAGTLLGADIQAAFMAISGVSSDARTGFFVDYAYNMHVVQRGSPSDPWSATVDGAPTPAVVNNIGGIPTADCRFVFTPCSTGGVEHTWICQLPRLD